MDRFIFSASNPHEIVKIRQSGDECLQMMHGKINTTNIMSTRSQGDIHVQKAHKYFSDICMHFKSLRGRDKMGEEFVLNSSASGRTLICFHSYTSG